MVKKAKSGKGNSTYFWPLFALVGVFVVGLTFYVANSKESTYTRSNAAGKGMNNIVMSIDLSSDTSFGGSVVFNVSAPKVKESDLYNLWVANACYLNGELVAKAYQPIKWTNLDSKSGSTDPITLGPTATWPSGEAECTGYVWSFPASETPLRGATVSYTVNP